MRPKIWEIDDDETLVNFIKAPTKGEKRRTNRENPSSRHKCKNPKSETGKGTNYVPQPPQVARTILEKEKDGKPESKVSLEEPSLSMCFKIEAPFVLCKAILCL